jgi:hypothetical protein
MENRRTSDFSELIDPNYLVGKGLNKSQLVTLVWLYLFRYKKIFLFTKLGDIEFPVENKALVTLHVAMAGSPALGIIALVSLRANMHRFFWNWLLRSASWRSASIDDMQ